MTADTRIPEDIMLAANELARHTGWYQRNDALNMARAILAERERCAMVARTFAWTIPTATSCDLDTHAERVAYTVQSQITAAIRGGA